MSEADVKKKLGSPDSTMETDQSSVMWSYLFTVKSNKAGLALGGFSINFKEGKVGEWFPIMLQTGPTFQSAGGKSIAAEQSFKSFVANDSLTNIASAVDSEGTADVSSLKMSPALEFMAKVFVANKDNERSNFKTVFLNISAQDAAKLKELTENNVGKRLIIVYRNQAFAAPLISTPLDSQQLMFDVKSSVVSKININ